MDITVALPSLQAYLEPWLLFVADDPFLRAMQAGLLLIGAILIFLVFYTTRDILLRTNSFVYMFVSIVIVAAFPVVGFLFYLLIRPSRTVREREMHVMLVELLKNSKKVAGKNDASPAKKKKAPVKKT